MSSAQEILLECFTPEPEEHVNIVENNNKKAIPNSTRPMRSFVVARTIEFPATDVACQFKNVLTLWKMKNPASDEEAAMHFIAASDMNDDGTPQSFKGVLQSVAYRVNDENMRGYYLLSPWLVERMSENYTFFVHAYKFLKPDWYDPTVITPKIVAPGAASRSPPKPSLPRPTREERAAVRAVENAERRAAAPRKVAAKPSRKAAAAPRRAAARSVLTDDCVINLSGLGVSSDVEEIVEDISDDEEEEAEKMEVEAEVPLPPRKRHSRPNSAENSPAHSPPKNAESSPGSSPGKEVPRDVLIELALLKEHNSVLKEGFKKAREEVKEAKDEAYALKHDLITMEQKFAEADAETRQVHKTVVNLRAQIRQLKTRPPLTWSTPADYDHLKCKETATLLRNRAVAAITEKEALEKKHGAVLRENAALKRDLESMKSSLSTATLECAKMKANFAKNH